MLLFYSTLTLSTNFLGLKRKSLNDSLESLFYELQKMHFVAISQPIESFLLLPKKVLTYKYFQSDKMSIWRVTYWFKLHKVICWKYPLKNSYVWLQKLLIHICYYQRNRSITSWHSKNKNSTKLLSYIYSFISYLLQWKFCSYNNVVVYYIIPCKWPKTKVLHETYTYFSFCMKKFCDRVQIW